MNEMLKAQLVEKALYWNDYEITHKGKDYVILNEVHVEEDYKEEYNVERWEEFHHEELDIVYTIGKIK